LKGRRRGGVKLRVEEEEEISSYWITSKKRENTENSNKKH
jgi:hypothetical protein